MMYICEKCGKGEIKEGLTLIHIIDYEIDEMFGRPVLGEKNYTEYYVCDDCRKEIESLFNREQTIEGEEE